jgi:hypothetical protein
MDVPISTWKFHVDSANLSDGANKVHIANESEDGVCLAASADSANLVPGATMRLFFVGTLCALLVACGGRANVQCEQDSNCDLSGGGKCLGASSGTGDQWCAYPDPECPSGYRYSNEDVGDGLSGVCVATSLGDAGTDAPADATLGWSSPSALANVNTTADERFPAPSADRLELYFSRLISNPPYGEIYVARRTSTSQSFGTPVAVTEVNGSNTNEIFAVPAHSGLELFMSEAGQIMRYTRPNVAATWGNGSYTGIDATFVSLSPDDLSMYVVMRCPQNVHSATGPCWFYASRASVGATWSTPTYVSFDADSQWNCADVSADGLHLLVSGNFSGTGIPVAEQQRHTTADAWSGTAVINALDLESTNNDARWDASGTEVYLSARPASNSSNGYDIFVSVLQ